MENRGEAGSMEAEWPGSERHRGDYDVERVKDASTMYASDTHSVHYTLVTP